MDTESPSPKSRLRLVVNNDGPRPARSTAARWLGFNFHCGQLVREKGSRHCARILAIHSSVFASIRYVENGWRAEVQLADLEAVSCE